MLSDEGGTPSQARDTPRWLRAVNGVLNTIDRTLMIVAGTLIFCIVLVVVLQVVMRYVFNSPTVWSEELATLMFVWFVLLGIPIVLRHQEHIRVEMISEIPLKWIRPAAQALGNVCFIVLFAVMGYYSLQLIPSSERQLMGGLSQAFGADIHLNAIYWAVPIGSALTILFAIEQLVRRPRSHS